MLGFCSNDYLGLANHPDVVKALQQGAQTYGAGSGASHLICGHTQAHHQLEQELAEFTQRPRALLYSTGYMANLGIITALCDKQDGVFEDRLNHASLLDAGLQSGARLQRYLHNDVASLEAQLEKSTVRNKLIATDGVFSMDGDVAPLQELSQVAQHHDALLMVDDAHGLGVLGAQGRGSGEALSEQQLPILMGTLGKAFGVFGAFVAGSEDLVETLIQLSRSYTYTTAMPGAVAEACRASLKLVQTESWRRDKVLSLVQQFRDGAQQLGFNLSPSQTPIQAIITGENQKALHMSQKLAEQGLLISAIRPPTVPKGTARLRITFSAAHEAEHIERLLDALEACR